MGEMATATMSGSVWYWRSLAICPSGLPLFTSISADNPTSASFNSCSAFLIPARQASQKGEFVLFKKMMRFSPAPLPLDEELLSPQPANISEKHAHNVNNIRINMDTPRIPRKVAENGF